MIGFTSKGVLSQTEKCRWSKETTGKLLKNEKYIEAVLLQKTYVKVCFRSNKLKMWESMNIFYIGINHPAIVSRELLEKVNGKRK
ncbi:MAG: recombinase family protein [Lawsonibacter sp.]